MSEPTQEQIAKLPKWARDHIDTLSRWLKKSQYALDDFCDSQTESQLYVDEWVCTGEESGASRKRYFIQSVTFNVAGSKVRIAQVEGWAGQPVLRINADNRLLFRPAASNQIEVVPE